MIVRSPGPGDECDAGVGRPGQNVHHYDQGGYFSQSPLALHGLLLHITRLLREPFQISKHKKHRHTFNGPSVRLKSSEENTPAGLTDGEEHQQVTVEDNSQRDEEDETAQHHSVTSARWIPRHVIPRA